MRPTLVDLEKYREQKRLENLKVVQEAAFKQRSREGFRINIGDINCFVDKESNCDCDTLGGTVFNTVSGRRITPTTFKEYASYTSSARDPLIIARMEEDGDPVVSASASCSKCGNVEIDNAPWL